MKEIKRCEGLVLTNEPYKETAALVKILTPKGLKSFIVRGASKLTTSTHSFLNYPLFLSFMHTNSSLPTITEGKVLNNYYPIKKDLVKYNLFLVVLEKILAFADNVTNFQIFYDFVLKTLSNLDESEYPFSYLMIFEIKLTYLLGIAPIFKVKSNSEIYFSPKEATLSNIPKDGSFYLDEEDSLLLKKAYLVKGEVSEELLKDLNKAYQISECCDLYYEYHLSFYSKTKKVIKELMFNDNLS